MSRHTEQDRRRMQKCMAAAIKAMGTKSKLADAIVVPWQSVHDWAVGRKPVPPHQARKIELATRGAVRAAEILPDVFG